MSQALQVVTDAKVRSAWLRVLLAEMRAYDAKCKALATEQVAKQAQRKESR